MRSPCPPKELLGQFLEDELPPTSEENLESHLRACDDCRERLEQLAADSNPTPNLSVHIHPPLSAEFAQRLEDSLWNALQDGDCDWDRALPEIPGYELLEMIGRGGSSVVFRAQDQKLQRMWQSRFCASGPAGWTRSASVAKPRRSRPCAIRTSPARTAPGKPANIAT